MDAEQLIMEDTTAYKDNSQHDNHGQHFTSDDSKPRSGDISQHKNHGQNIATDDSKLRSDNNNEHGFHGQQYTMGGHKTRSDRNKRARVADGSSVYNSETCLGNCWLPNGKVAFQCDKCREDCSSEELLNDHKLTHCYKNHFLCDICGRGFSSNDLLTDHLDTHKLDCNYLELSGHKCGTVLNSFTSFAFHHDQHKHRIGANFTCRDCGKAFAKKSNLYCHLLTHKGDEPYTCDFCGEEFAHKYLLEYHIRNHMGVFICYICGKVTSTGSALKAHVLSHGKPTAVERTGHEDVHLTCKYCNEKFSYRRHVAIHNKVHVAKNRWKCNVCGTIVLSKGHLLKHKYVRHNQRKLTYALDGTDLRLKGKPMKVLTSAYSISKCLKCETVDCPHTHVRYHCKMCGYKIAKGYNVRSHLLLHNAKDMYSYVCVRCDRPFSTKKGLEIHSRTSTCRNPLKYGLTFRSRLALLHHENDHYKNPVVNFKGGKIPYKKLPDVELIGLKVKTRPKCRSCTLHKQNRNVKIGHKCGRCNVHLKSKQVPVTRKVKEIFKCTYCSKSFREEYCLSVHMDRHRLASRHKCRLCVARFTTKTLLKKHVGGRHFECKLCFQRFHTRKNLEMHTTVHITKYKWKCKGCNKIFFDKKSLIIHSNINHGILHKRKRKQIATECVRGLCAMCGMCNTSNVRYSSSKEKGEEICILYEGNKVTPREIFIKAKALSDAKVLNKCLRIVQDRTRHPPTCSTCGIQFDCRIFLQDHNRRVHCSYSCSYCFIEFENYGEYNYHMQFHDYVCGLCGFEMCGYTDSLEHLQTHGLGLRCICGQSFKYLADSAYENHTKSCFTCESCFKQFADASELKKHGPCFLPKHSIENKIFCEFCGKCFTSVQRAARHSEFHKSECKHFRIKFLSVEHLRANYQYFQDSNRSSIFCVLCDANISCWHARNYIKLVKKSTLIYSCNGCSLHFLQNSTAIEHCSSIHNDKWNYRVTPLFSKNLTIGAQVNTPTSTHNDNTAAFHRKPRICSLQQAADTRFSLQSSGMDLITSSRLGHSPGQNQHQLARARVIGIEEAGNPAGTSVFKQTSPNQRMTAQNQQKKQNRAVFNSEPGFVDPNELQLTRPHETSFVGHSNITVRNTDKAIADQNVQSQDKVHSNDRTQSLEINQQPLIGPHVGRVEKACNSAGKSSFTEISTNKAITHQNPQHNIGSGELLRQLFMKPHLNKHISNQQDNECDQGLCNSSNVKPQFSHQTAEEMVLSGYMAAPNRIIEIEKDKSIHPPTCSTCGIQFDCKIFLQDHNRRFHCLHSCSYCFLEFENYIEYYKHMKFHKYICGQCGCQMNGYFVSLNHMQTHGLGLRCIYGQSFKYLAVSKYDNNFRNCFTCESCFVQFASALELKKHEPCNRLKHSLEHMFFCQICGLSFTSVQECTKHSKTHKSHCKHFRVQFTSLEQLRANVEFFGASNRSIMLCESCNSEINIKCLTCKHYRKLVQSTTVIYSCNGCSLHFLQRIRAMLHCLTVHNKQSTFRVTPFRAKNIKTQHNKQTHSVDPNKQELERQCFASVVRNSSFIEKSTNNTKALQNRQQIQEKVLSNLPTHSDDPNQQQLQIPRVVSVVGNSSNISNTFAFQNHQQNQVKVAPMHQANFVEPIQQQSTALEKSTNKAKALQNQQQCQKRVVSSLPTHIVGPNQQQLKISHVASVVGNSTIVTFPFQTLQQNQDKIDPMHQANFVEPIQQLSTGLENSANKAKAVQNQQQCQKRGVPSLLIHYFGTKQQQLKISHVASLVGNSNNITFPFQSHQQNEVKVAPMHQANSVEPIQQLSTGLEKSTNKANALQNQQERQKRVVSSLPTDSDYPNQQQLKISHVVSLVGNSNINTFPFQNNQQNQDKIVPMHEANSVEPIQQQSTRLDAISEEETRFPAANMKVKQKLNEKIFTQQSIQQNQDNVCSNLKGQKKLKEKLTVTLEIKDKLRDKLCTRQYKQKLRKKICTQQNHNQSNTLSSHADMEIETNDGTSANCLQTSIDATETDIDSMRSCVLNDHTYARLVVKTRSDNIGDAEVKELKMK